MGLSGKSHRSLYFSLKEGQLVLSDFYLQKHSRDQSSRCFPVWSLLWVVWMFHINLAGELLTSAATFVVWATGRWCCGHIWCQVGLEGWIYSLRRLWFWPICSSSLQQSHKNVMDEYWLCCFILLPLLYWHELIGQKQKADSVQSGKRFYVNRDCKIRNRALRVNAQDSWPNNTTCPQEKDSDPEP